jgi:hypothetical protein
MKAAFLPYRLFVQRQRSELDAPMVFPAISDASRSLYIEGLHGRAGTDRQFVLSWLEGGEGVKRFLMVPCFKQRLHPLHGGGVVGILNTGLG